MISRERIIEELEIVQDPELGLDVWTLGLVRDIEIVTDTHVKLGITYTTPLCPYGPALNADITQAMYDLGFKACEIELSFDPPWEPPPNLREMLGV